MKQIDAHELHNLVHDLSVKFFNEPFLDEVIFNHRLRTTGGRYLPAKKRIELNPKYVYEMNTDEFIGIIKHELCHYHLHIEGKGYKHKDQDFKQLLKKTESPRHCKPLPSMESSYNYTYRCNQCHHTYKRMRRINTAKYRCGKCRGKLQFHHNIK